MNIFHCICESEKKWLKVTMVSQIIEPEAAACQMSTNNTLRGFLRLPACVTPCFGAVAQVAGRPLYTHTLSIFLCTPVSVGVKSLLRSFSLIQGSCNVGYLVLIALERPGALNGQATGNPGFPQLDCLTILWYLNLKLIIKKMKAVLGILVFPWNK